MTHFTACTLRPASLGTAADIVTIYNLRLTARSAPSSQLGQKKTAAARIGWRHFAVAGPDCAIFRARSFRTDVRVGLVDSRAMMAMATPFAWIMRANMGIEDDDAIELIVRLDYPLHWANMDTVRIRLQ